MIKLTLSSKIIKSSKNILKISQLLLIGRNAFQKFYKTVRGNNLMVINILIIKILKWRTLLFKILLKL